mmetsp:Transcript_21300/g.64097  ORF Transcript_21300/g.64097 Transcript_21300/m.64097 type:complete len:200 (-) Transcript_21300:1389-1988(-)
MCCWRDCGWRGGVGVPPPAPAGQPPQAAPGSWHPWQQPCPAPARPSPPRQRQYPLRCRPEAAAASEAPPHLRCLACPLPRELLASPRQPGELSPPFAGWPRRQAEGRPHAALHSSADTAHSSGGTDRGRRRAWGACPSLRGRTGATCRAGGRLGRRWMEARGGRGGRRPLAAAASGGAGLPAVRAPALSPYLVTAAEHW